MKLTPVHHLNTFLTITFTFLLAAQSSAQQDSPKAVDRDYLYIKNECKDGTCRAEFRSFAFNTDTLASGSLILGDASLSFHNYNTDVITAESEIGWPRIKTPLTEKQIEDLKNILTKTSNVFLDEKFGEEGPIRRKALLKIMTAIKDLRERSPMGYKADVQIEIVANSNDSEDISIVSFGKHGVENQISFDRIQSEPKNLSTGERIDVDKLIADLTKAWKEQVPLSLGQSSIQRYLPEELPSSLEESLTPSVEH